MARKGYSGRGRPPGSKTIKAVDGVYTNQYGVSFTEEQKKALERAVDKSNRMRRKAIKEDEANRPDKTDLRLMGKENEFIVSRQSRTLQKFKSAEEFEDYLDKQRRIHSGEYLADRARAYKRNFTDSLLATYGDEAKDIAMKIRMMKPEEYMKMVANDERLEIRFVPSDERVAGRLNQLRSALGMNLKDEWFDEEYDV